MFNQTSAFYKMKKYFHLDNKRAILIIEFSGMLDESFFI